MRRVFVFWGMLTLAVPRQHAGAQASDLEAAESAINRGHPWRATQLVAPLLRNPQKRTPGVVIVAARAAAGWGGWSEVDKLLSKEPWIDAQFNGDGRELLARSALERGADTAALTHATAALRDAKSAGVRAERLVFVARAFERNNKFDSAGAAYTRAGAALPAIRDWLLLRAAGSEPDSANRAKLFAGVVLAPAKPRIVWTDAQARERFADALGAAARYTSLGAAIPAFRLRLSVAPDSASRDGIKNEALSFIRTHNGSADAKSAVEVLDKAFTSFAPAEELIIARSTATSGPPARSVAAFQRAVAEPALITPNDRLLYAQVLSRVSRTRDALAQLDAVQGPLAAQAGYQRARALLTGGTADATRAALRDVIAKFPNDTSAASSALYLLADLSVDDGNDDQASAFYRQLYHGYPTSARAASARFNSAIINFSAGKQQLAALELDSLLAALPRSDESTAARYWSGRAWAAAGSTTRAQAKWREIVEQQPTSYYAPIAARRLEEKPWAPPARADSFPRVAAVDSAFSRAALLERLGMDAEARFEYDALESSASASPDRLLATAHAFESRGQPWRAMRLAQRLIDSGQRDARAYRLLFPILDRDELTRDATAHSLDPALVAGLIRQESSFNPRAVSVAGARGLMQVLPAVGEEISRSLSYPVWYAALLLDADANLQLGTAHLAAYTKQYGELPRVLAAYNAGGSRATRWS
ncbi:MAG TPA: transglycosylase SLT domain-containing protein, partial [Gemmatimonadaceae bacterium]|nr:transglycosylase SLT domain-containing protein [Gemmatimonadaceae bacterium]